MNILPAPRTLHPVQWVAAVAVILFALAGTAAITGLIPVSKSAEPATGKLPVASTPTPTPATKVAAAPITVKKPIAKARLHPAKHATPQIARTNAVTETPPAAPAVCIDCGHIESVQRIVQDGNGSGVGAVAGGVIGGALGNRVGNGNGRAVATLAGLIGGAVLGNHIEKSQKQTVNYQTVVRFDDGTSRVFNSTYEQGFREGERVRLVNGAIQPE